LKILYIEDRDSYQRTLRRLATQMGHELISASTGARGYELAKLTVDLILLDINLPDGNGLDLARRLRAENIRTPIVVVSADVMNYSHPDAIQAGCDDFIEKPFELALVRQRIAHYLSQAQGQPSSQSEA